MDAKNRFFEEQFKPLVQQFGRNIPQWAKDRVRDNTERVVRSIKELYSNTECRTNSAARWELQAKDPITEEWGIDGIFCEACKNTLMQDKMFQDSLRAMTSRWRRL